MTLFSHVSLAQEESAAADKQQESASAEAPTPAISDVSGQEDAPARKVRIELEQAEGASFYQVELRRYLRNLVEPQTFILTPEEPTFFVNLTPADYEIRTRSLDKHKIPGPWGGWRKFTIDFRTVNDVRPANGEKILPESTKMETITFEWPAIPLAAEYLIVLFNEKGEVIHSHQTANLWYTYSVAHEAKYNWALVPIRRGMQITPEEVAADQSRFKVYSFEVLKPDPGLKEVTFNLTKSRLVAKYRFEITKLDREGKEQKPRIKESLAQDFSLGLYPGAYKVRLQSVFVDGSQDEWSEPQSLFVTYPEAVGVSPKNEFLIDPDDDLESTVELEWKGAKDVAFYSIYVTKPSGELVAAYKTDGTSTEIKLPHNARYRWVVIPHSFGEPIRPLPTEGGQEFMIDYYIRLAMATPEEPSQFYGWGRYWTSMINYVGKNYDLNSLTEQPIYGGTAEAAIGYWHRKTRYGIMGNVALAGFVREGSTSPFNWVSGGVYLGYRRVLEGDKRFRYWVGWSYVETPEIIRDAFTFDFDFHRVSSMGPQVQVSYMNSFDFNPRHGYHIYGILYRPMQFGESPNGLPQKPELNYTFGLTWTYAKNENQKWSIGYNYRREALRYKTTDPSGKDNTSEVTGHYLNLAIDFNLARKRYR